MESRFHIKSNGNPGRCEATTTCPLGGDLESDHYSTPQEAREAYEKVQSEKTAGEALRRTKVRFKSFGDPTTMTDEQLLALADQRKRDEQAVREEWEEAYRRSKVAWQEAGERNPNGDQASDPTVAELQERLRDYQALCGHVKQSALLASGLVVYREDLREQPEATAKREEWLEQCRREGRDARALRRMEKAVEASKAFTEKLEATIGEWEGLLRDHEQALATGSWTTTG